MKEFIHNVSALLMVAFIAVAVAGMLKFNGTRVIVGVAGFAVAMIVNIATSDDDFSGWGGITDWM